MKAQPKESDDVAVEGYIGLQKRVYKQQSIMPEARVVGHYDYHEIVPYETNLLYVYGDIRRPIFDDFSQLRAFDICCGEGRMVRRMQKLFAQVDGADISEDMIGYAKDRTKGSEFWVTNGQN